jgi:hypothetical protein
MRWGSSRVDSIVSSLLEKDRRPIPKIFERCIEAGYCIKLEQIEYAALADDRVDTSAAIMSLFIIFTSETM